MCSYFLKFGDLDPGSADFFLQEERIKQLRSSYEAQCRVITTRSLRVASSSSCLPVYSLNTSLAHSIPVWQELQDRIDELQSELQEFHSLGRVHQPCHKPLSEELESKSPGMESDPGRPHKHLDTHTCIHCNS